MDAERDIIAPRSRVLKKKTPTHIFDGQLIEASKQTKPKQTFKSKNLSQSVDQLGKRVIHLPQVALAVRKHTLAKEMIARQRKADEEREEALAQEV